MNVSFPGGESSSSPAAAPALIGTNIESPLGKDIGVGLVLVRNKRVKNCKYTVAERCESPKAGLPFPGRKKPFHRLWLSEDSRYLPARYQGISVLECPLFPLPRMGKGTEGFAILVADTSLSSPLSPVLKRLLRLLALPCSFLHSLNVSTLRKTEFPSVFTMESFLWSVLLTWLLLVEISNLGL